MSCVMLLPMIAACGGGATEVTTDGDTQEPTVQKEKAVYATFLVGAGGGTRTSSLRSGQVALFFLSGGASPSPTVDR